MPKKTDKEPRLLPPKLVVDNCLKYEASTKYDGILLRVYKWAGTDYVDVVWYGSYGKAIAMLELYYLQLYDDFGKLLADLPNITDEMHEHGWGYLDMRDLSVKRVFDVEVP